MRRNRKPVSPTAPFLSSSGPPLLRSAYGLCLASDLSFEDLPTCNGLASVEVPLSWVPSGSVSESSAQYADSEVTLSYEGLCRITIAHGRSIAVTAESGTPEAVLEHFVVGVGMGVLLHQRRETRTSRERGARFGRGSGVRWSIHVGQVDSRRLILCSADGR